MPIMKHIRMTMRLGLMVGLDAMFLARPTVVHNWFPLTLACSVDLAKSTLSLFRHSDRFDFVFSLRCID